MTNDITTHLIAFAVLQGRVGRCYRSVPHSLHMSKSGSGPYDGIKLCTLLATCNVAWYIISVVSVCQTLTFESPDVRTSSYLHIRCISREYGSSSYIKVIESRSRLHQQKSKKSIFKQCKTSIARNYGSTKERDMRFVCIMGFLAKTDWMVWPRVTKCTHSRVVGLRLKQNLVIIIKLESLMFLTTCAYTTWHHKFYNDWITQIIREPCLSFVTFLQCHRLAALHFKNINCQYIMVKRYLPHNYVQN